MSTKKPTKKLKLAAKDLSPRKDAKGGGSKDLGVTGSASPNGGIRAVTGSAQPNGG